jgi:hypothetical protein
MSSNVVNQVAYLRTSREFPPEMHQLSVELTKSYIDTASSVNVRTIGIFPTNRPAITGEGWFLEKNQKQQSLRQAYTFETTADIPIGFKVENIAQFSKMHGVYTIGTNTDWYGLIPATPVAIAGQITFYIFVDVASTTTDLIRFVVGGGAPALTYGTIVLEWLSFP